MNFTGAFFRFLVYSNLFIALCAVLMVHQTYALLIHSYPPWAFVFFVGGATICSYSFHWYLTPVITQTSSRLEWLKRNRKLHLAGFFLGLTATFTFGLMLLDHWPWLLLSATITFLYSAPKIPHPLFRALRKVAVGKTLFLAFVWTYVTSILPLQISDHAWQTDFSLFALSRFCLIYAICILFDHRDREYDLSIGIRSLITWLSEKNITRLFILSLLLFFLSTLSLLQFGHSYSVIIALLIPGVITAFLYKQAVQSKSDMLYYFVLDGLMALSAVFTMIPGI